MSDTALPPDDESEHKNPFDEFIDHDLDTSGLEDTRARPKAPPPFAGESGFEFVLPSGATLSQPESDGALELVLPGPSSPLWLKSGWKQRIMQPRPDTLFITDPEFGYESARRGTLVLPMDRRSTRRIEVIPDYKPGFFAVCYEPNKHQTAQFRPSAPGKPPSDVEVAGQVVRGLVRSADLPALREEAGVMRLFHSFDAGAVVVVVLMLFPIIAMVLLLRQQEVLNVLQQQIAALQAQLQALPVK